MDIVETGLKGAYIFRPRVFGDERGWFMESFNEKVLREAGIDIPAFVQDNHSYSAEVGTLRGLHCQLGDHAQTKLVRCTRGEIDDYIVDVRKGSPSYMKHIVVRLSAENKNQLYVPKGFLHGFVTRTPDVEVQYKVDAYYDKASDRSVRYDDPVFGIDWGVTAPVLSAKDAGAPLYADSDVRFVYHG